jgi:tight adherence protein B
MVKIVSLLVFLFLALGIMRLFEIKFEDLIDLFRGKKKAQTLADTLALYAPNKIQENKNRIRKHTTEIRDILRLSGQEDKFSKVKVYSIALAIIGISIAVVIDKLILAPIIAIAMAIVPFIYLQMLCNKYQKSIDETIESTLSIITNSFLRTESIVLAVKENLPYIQKPLQICFQEFVNEVEIINPNVTMALNNLKDKVPNPIFFDWCNRIIQCQTDRTLKNTLLGIVSKMSDLRTLRAEMNAKLAAPKAEAIAMGAITLGNIPLLYFLNKDWYDVLVNTVPGQIALAIVLSAVLIGSLIIWRLCQPISYKDIGGDY